MWYLIIPPIVVVVSLSFVLWYLSRKGADPSVVRKISQLAGGVEQKVSFFRTKNFFLRILEKTAHRFKILFLQMHNTLNDLTQLLKERRRRFQEKDGTVALKAPGAASAHEVVSESPQPLLRSQAVAIAGMKRFVQPVPTTRLEATEAVSRPMVSETMVHPEESYHKTSADVVHEDGLIARIAVNPKDFVAYEELGDHYLKIGNMKDAKECYRQVLKLSSVQRMAKIKIRRLEKMLLQKEQ
ncbi:MAG: hypothetical protein WAV46_02755 [Candidatus Moraniibacteriota bacterium]